MPSHLWHSPYCWCWLVALTCVKPGWWFWVTVLHSFLFCHVEGKTNYHTQQGAYNDQQIQSKPILDHSCLLVDGICLFSAHLFVVFGMWYIQWYVLWYVQKEPKITYWMMILFPGQQQPQWVCWFFILYGIAFTFAYLEHYLLSA